MHCEGYSKAETGHRKEFGKERGGKKNFGIFYSIVFAAEQQASNGLSTFIFVPLNVGSFTAARKTNSPS